MKIVLQAICVVILAACVSSEWPASVEKCAYGDKKCIMSSANNILMELVGGNSELPLPILDPLDTHDLQFSEKSNALGLKLQMNDTQTLGLREAKITNVKGFGEDPNGRHELLFSAPVLSLIGDYAASGKILLLSIQGIGKANFTMIQPTIKVTIDGVAQTKENEVYMDVESTKLHVKCQRLLVDFTDLLNNQKDIAENILQLVNENWQLIFDDLNEPLFGGINNRIFHIIKAVFAKTPYKQMFKN